MSFSKEREDMTKRVIALLFVICCIAVTAFSQTAAPTPAPAPKFKPEHFSAVASFARAPATTASWVDVRVQRYTSNATAQKMAALLIEGGQDALVKALEDAKSIGKVQLSGRVGFFDLKLIRSRKTATGRRVIGVSDRPIGFMEMYNSGRSVDYKLGIVAMDLKIDKKGKEVGQGKLIYAARVKINKKGTLEIEYLGMEPISLRNVKKY
jgi:hypothetical protein